VEGGAIRLRTPTARIVLWALLAVATCWLARALAQNADLVARGKYLVEVAANCGECHTPLTATGEPDDARHLAGHVTGTPVPSNTSFKDFHTGAVTYARNLTPDRETGLGGWTKEEFRLALREGIARGGRPLRRPMPWERFRKLFSDADVDAIWAYLQSLPAVKNGVPEP
jgi:hypothetical protein